MQRAIAANPEARFYLATDSSETKQKFRRLFEGRIITFDETADRAATEGFINAVVDLYTLAGTKKIIGSHASSFSGTAAQIGGIDLSVARSDAPTRT